MSKKKSESTGAWVALSAALGALHGSTAEGSQVSSLDEAAYLNSDALRALRDRYGTAMKVRSSSPLVDEIIKGESEALQQGYSRTYDKDIEGPEPKTYSRYDRTR